MRISFKMKARTLFLIGGLLVVFAVPASAQTVSGGVYDAESAAPLSGVLVSLLDLDGNRVTAVLTDDEGSFTMESGGFGRFSLRAERIGLQTTTSGSFDVFGSEPTYERILMGARAVEIEGLVVDSRVRQCRTDPREAVQIQRWWLEVRTALDVSSVVQGQGIAQFRVERFQREWDATLDRIIGSSAHDEISLADRPFVSAEADFFADGGYVQGELSGQREYYAPDADVLLSDSFLSLHCFRVVEHDDRDEWVGLSFEPTRIDGVVDIGGVLWVDSTTAELQSLDYRYSDIEDVPENEAGGYVSFEYLESGAWIVREWFIRMPRLGQQRAGRDLRLVLLGYTDVGGRVTPIELSRTPMDRVGEVGAIRGVVYDSIRGRPLQDALVSILATSYQVRTDRSGEFMMTNIPVGEHQLTFFHDDPEAWGLGSRLVEVEVDTNRTSSTYMALPAFRQAANVICMGSGPEASAVLVGRLVDGSGAPLGNVPLEFSWEALSREGGLEDFTTEVRTGANGRFVICTIPGDVRVNVSAYVLDRWVEGFEVDLPRGDVVFRQMLIPIGD